MKTRTVVEIVAIVIGAIALLGAALVGSSFLVPQGTQVQYDPGDGVGLTVGDVDVEGAIVITEDGELGNLIFTAVNGSDRDVTLTVQYPSGGDRADVSVEIPAGERVGFGYGTEGQLALEEIGVPAGGLIPLYFQYGSEPGVQIDVPVLDGAFAEYAPLVPTPAPTPTPTPTATETPAAEG